MRLPMLTSQKVTSPPTQAQTTRGRMGRRRGASRRLSTMTVTPPLLHQETMTTKTRPRKIKQLIKIIHLIILTCHTIQMHIYCLFHSIPPTLVEMTTLFRVIKCVVIYFLSILAFGK
jgi:hypothetical protein